ncbi:hypothetical protein CROQUDRAFT_652577 [Cronartium quercuum f. sp. fusiforme G11]|uniref:Uncharacterized protein n=1 Tax=Cronartium quercuum f. sp. fusiforme G11 TaxID=708437 RepID=A0A9P6NTX5_9BASI|nr:hypothetical protein CROQUDRAFT_652577 [Cronartium quercuum f. sp. fusiforme G11]
MANSNRSEVLGVVVIMRHGDRQGFYQDPSNYVGSQTTLSPLGEQQAYDAGHFLRARYLEARSSDRINALASEQALKLFDQDSFEVLADNGGEGGVIADSVTSAFQGMFPPTPNRNITLANGQFITSPLQGYQYVPVITLDPLKNISLEPWTDCDIFVKMKKKIKQKRVRLAFNQHIQKVYSSKEFKDIESENSKFLNSLVPILGNRIVNFNNMYNIFDYVNVQSIHNSTFLSQVSNTTLAQVRHLANVHEQGVFTDRELGGIGNLAGRTVLALIFEALNSMTSQSVKKKMTFIGLAYKPFLSIMNMTQISLQGLSGMVNYASLMTFELRAASTTSQPFVRLSFRNGTAEPQLTAYPMMGSSSVDYPLVDLYEKLKPALLQNLSEWCSLCSNSHSRGCELIVADENNRKDGIWPVGASFLGVVALLALSIGVVYFLWKIINQRRKKNLRNRKGLDSDKS